MQLDGDGFLMFDQNADGTHDVGDGVIDQDGKTEIDGSAFDDVTVFGNTLHGFASFVMNGQIVVVEPSKISEHIQSFAA